MRAFKISVALVLVLGSAALAGLTYIQSHGAGISTGVLLALVIISYTYDHRHQIFGTGEPAGREGDAPSSVKGVATKHGRLIAMHQDGAFAPRNGR